MQVVLQSLLARGLHLAQHFFYDATGNELGVFLAVVIYLYFLHLLELISTPALTPLPLGGTAGAVVSEVPLVVEVSVVAGH